MGGGCEGAPASNEQLLVCTTPTSVTRQLPLAARGTLYDQPPFFKSVEIRAKCCRVERAVDKANVLENARTRCTTEREKFQNCLFNHQALAAVPSGTVDVTNIRFSYGDKRAFHSSPLCNQGHDLSIDFGNLRLQFTLNRLFQQVHLLHYHKCNAMNCNKGNNSALSIRGLRTYAWREMEPRYAIGHIEHFA